MQMLLITHADRQNANICFSAKPTVISRKTNVYQKKKKKLYALMYTCDVIHFGERQKHTNLCVCRAASDKYLHNELTYLHLDFFSPVFTIKVRALFNQQQPRTFIFFSARTCTYSHFYFVFVKSKLQIKSFYRLLSFFHDTRKLKAVE